MGRPISEVKKLHSNRKRKMIKKMVAAPVERKCLRCDRKFLSFNNFRICARCTCINKYVEEDFNLDTWSVSVLY